ncbi:MULTISPECIES: hypothetical protein [unclassified Nostoc]|nr:hypothetical protein [Nostoc sp. 'Peltigera membranacea cyanobiont' 232]OYE01816.1 hypothetical protein CDG79_27355 [Nostoc sp. 'Peltigera membranacea cyanobiont' 232]
MNAIDDKRRREEGLQEARLVRREETANEPNADSDRSPSPGYDISSSKHEQIGSDRNNDSRQNAAVAICCGNEDPGKIKQRLSLIERSFLSYVRSHQQRLEARLDESRALEQNFLDSLKELEREINSLTSQSQKNEHPDLEESPELEITQTEENS